MASEYDKRLGSVVVIVALVIMLGALLLTRPQCAWNSGTYDRLTGKLSEIGQGLAKAEEGDPSTRLDPIDFIPRSVTDDSDAVSQHAQSLTERYGVPSKWHRSGWYQDLVGTYEDIFFYPVALSETITVEPHSTEKPVPQIVMVPVEEIDMGTLPNLHGCTGATAEERQESQLRRMKALFAENAMDTAVALMSDGSVSVVRVDEL